MSIMQLILHIGTHKTGTSALQECLRRNERDLAENGIFYARMPRSRNCNGLAQLVVKKRYKEARTVIGRQVEQAKALGAHTLLISAESFFATTSFYSKLFARPYNDYWQSEQEFIQLLGNIVPSSLSTRLIVFFRRQDHFIESVYRQVVKSRSVSMHFNDFIECMSEALDYSKHIEIWSKTFPNCAVYAYEEACGSISEFFIRKVLLLDGTSFKGLNERVNRPLSRDLLEYKRLLNEQLTSAVEKRMCKIACTRLARTIADDNRYQEYLAPAERASLLRRFERGNALLCSKFGMSPFPLCAENSAGWTPYPGLTPERTAELARHYAQQQRSFDYRLERAALLTRAFIKERLPIFRWVIPIGRRLLPNRRPLT